MLNPDIGRCVLAGGIDTNYHECGDGPAVLLIHGSGPGTTAYSNWRLTMPLLAERFRVLAPDLVGFGYTALPSFADYELDLWVAHILHFLDGVSADKVHVVGNSFGGAIALALATRHPERVDKLVLTGALGAEFPLTEALDAVWGYRPSLAAMESLIRVYAFDQEFLSPEIVRARFEASTRPGYHEVYARLFPAPRQEQITKLSIPPELLRSLPHRTLILHGREDKVVPWQASIALHDLIPRSQLHVFGQCGHWTTFEKTHEFNEIVFDFLCS